MPCVLFNVADDTSNSFVAGPWCRELRFSEGFDYPRYVCIFLWVTPQVVEPLFSIRSW